MVSKIKKRVMISLNKQVVVELNARCKKEGCSASTYIENLLLEKILDRKD